MPDQIQRSSQPPRRPKKQIEVKREIFTGKIRHGPEDHERNRSLPGDSRQRHTLHIDGGRAGRSSERLLVLGATDDLGHRNHRADSDGYPELRCHSLRARYDRAGARNGIRRLFPGAVIDRRRHAGADDQISDRCRRQCAGEPGGDRQRHRLPIQDQAGRRLGRLLTDSRLNQPVGSFRRLADQAPQAAHVFQADDRQSPTKRRQLPSGRDEHCDRRQRGLDMGL